VRYEYAEIGSKMKISKYISDAAARIDTGWRIHFDGEVYCAHINGWVQICTDDSKMALELYLRGANCDVYYVG